MTATEPPIGRPPSLMRIRHSARVTPVEAACAVARQHSVQVVEPTVLSDTNNVVVWLAPSPVVAKVGTGHHRRLDAELHIVDYLVTAHAPVVGPAVGIPPRVHEHGGYEITLWT